MGDGTITAPAPRPAAEVEVVSVLIKYDVSPPLVRCELVYRDAAGEITAPPEGLPPYVIARGPKAAAIVNMATRPGFTKLVLKAFSDQGMLPGVSPNP